MLLYPLSDFISQGYVLDPSLATYWYGAESAVPERSRLPRTPLAEAIAQGLMRQLADDPQYAQEGKMYGVLLVETASGELRVLKAFSGLLNGQSVVEGWVPPIPGRDRVALAEAETLARLESMKQAIIALHHLPEREQYAVLAQTFEERSHSLSLTHQQRKQTRQQQRQQVLASLTGDDLASALEELDNQSRWDGIERRRFKQERDAALKPLQEKIAQADAQIVQLKQQRKQVSRQLQAQMHASYWLTNFAGESSALQQLMPAGTMPTGTGDCCAPKLLHYAATQGLKPLAMAEFWWGPPTAKGDKVPGEFYGACAERCQPLMGFLLSGLAQPASTLENYSTEPLSIVYQDQWLIAVNKPAGLLSVPGRYRDRQDSVLSRLRHLLPDGENLLAVHRLDQDTSGILLLARDLTTYRQLSRQFQQRQIHKVYEAILAGTIAVKAGTIDLPLSADLSDRPRQRVDWQQGKPSLTRFLVITTREGYTQIEFFPVTGRTHQLRVHAADPQGLGVPILGDRLYGCTSCTEPGSRLHLHARSIQFEHPQTGQIVHLQAETPFASPAIKLSSTVTTG